MDVNPYYQWYILTIFIIKFLFITCSFFILYYQYKNDQIHNSYQAIEIAEGIKKKSQTNSEEDEKYKENKITIENLHHDKQWFEFSFIIMMGFLMIYLFNPLRTKIPPITKGTQHLFFLFAVILMTNANWQIFFKENPLWLKFQRIIGRPMENIQIDERII